LTLQHERNRSIAEALAKTNSRPHHCGLTCRDALSWVTTGAAKIAGLDDRIGSVTVGKQADIVLLRTDALNMTPMHDLAGCAVMQAATANIDTVIIAGRVVKQSGKLLTNGLAEKMATLARSGERILADFNALPGRGA
jgi:5-methylthioadenosine/S-adenosylhomocysteine deaminase